MDKNDLKKRTKNFAIETIRFVNSLPKSKANDVISYQILKSAAPVAANYRSCLRGRSSAEFISKLNIVLEEADESMLWFEIIEETNKGIDVQQLKNLYKESDALTAIFSASIKTARKNLNSKN